MQQDRFGFRLEKKLHQGHYFSTYGAYRKSDNRPAVVKVLEAGSDNETNGLAALRNEYSILRELNLECTPLALGLIEEDGAWGLATEHLPGKALLEAIGDVPIELVEFLDLAISLVAAIDSLHAHRIVHKDINPSNVIANRATGEVWITGFDIAMRLSQQTAGFGTPADMEGTLAYISPEQTGRMNRPTDYRTDYYSLGATLFEALTGEKAFPFEEPLELVHSLLAHPPPAASAARSDVPIVLENILCKLMAKSADDRYQSATGLSADLQCVAQALKSDQFPEITVLGAKDVSKRFRLPSKLYGRGEAVAQLERCLELVRAGQERLVLVSGPSGIGKSVLVRELFRPITEAGGRFVLGKFEQYGGNSAYGAISQALSGLATQLLTESNSKLEPLRQTLIQKIGDNAPYLTALAPEFELLLGEKKKTVTSLSRESRNRLVQAVRDLVAVVTERGRPFCLFLDDIQWADFDSINLIENLALSARDRPVLLLLAFRDGEVDKTHPFNQSIATLEEAQIPTEELKVEALSRGEVGALLYDTFAINSPLADELTAVIHARTAGNPFFVRTFTTALVENGLVSHQGDVWKWDTRRIARRGVTDNVVELVLGKTHQLSAASRDVLRLGACMGSSFDINILKQACPKGTQVNALWEAIELGLVLPLGNIRGPSALTQAVPAERCRFAHDRIQHAILSDISPENKANLHRRLAQVLLRVKQNHLSAKQIFATVNHLNSSGSPRTSGEKKLRVRLNLNAAQRALETSAAERAAHFSASGLALLNEQDWKTSRGVLMDLHWCAAEAAYSLGNFTQLDRLGTILLKHGRAPVERARVYHLRAQVSNANNDVTEALQLDLQALSELGFHVPGSPTQQFIDRDTEETRAVLVGKDSNDLIGLEECERDPVRKEMEVLDSMILMSYFCASPQFPLLVGRLLRLSLQYGNSPYSACGYILYGVLEASRGSYESAAKFGRIAVAVAERFGNQTILSRTKLYVQYQVAHWTTPFPDAVRPLREAYSHGKSAGSPYESSVAAATLCIARFHAGQDLCDIESESQQLAATIAQYGQTQVLNWIDPYRQLSMNLSRNTERPCDFLGPAYLEADRVPGPKAKNDAAALFNYYYCKGLACFLFNDHKGAYEAIQANRSFLENIFFSTLTSAAVFTLDSLARLAVYNSLDSNERQLVIDKVRSNQKRLLQWAPHCPRKYQHNHDLVEAELARVTGDHSSARQLYRSAMKLANQCGVSSERAVVHELAGKYYFSCSLISRAQEALRIAYESYLSWGATTKARYLEETHSALLPQALSLDAGRDFLKASRSFGNNSGLLDIIGALQASQVISREVSLERLLLQLLSLLIKVSGAQSGMLLLQQDSGWNLRVNQTAADQLPQLVDRTILSNDDTSTPHAPGSILQYAIRTRKMVTLDNAMSDSRHSQDAYVKQHGVVSCLCLPLLRQGSVMGAVYLENNLAVGLFSTERNAALELIASQAVVSLENARLYDTLEQKVSERTSQLQRSNSELRETLSALKLAQERLIVQERLASLGALTSGLAHELRNPLNFVINFAKSSQRSLKRLDSAISTEKETTRQSIQAPLRSLDQELHMIQKHSSRIEGLIKSMLSHSSGNTGQRSMVNVNDLLQSYAQLAQHGSAVSNAPQVTFKTDFDKSIPALWLVPQEIGRVILNLVENAIFATREKGRLLAPKPHSPMVKLQTRNAGKTIEVRIQDNGMGMSQAVAKRAFEPFFTTKSAGSGTGLGLSISHEIISRGNGGNLSFDSIPGASTTFLMVLPISQSNSSNSKS